LSSGLAEPERQQALERLRASHFNETERVRAEALDSIR
jgi:lipase chaperone LimK